MVPSKISWKILIEIHRNLINKKTHLDSSWRDHHPVTHLLKDFAATAETKVATREMGRTDNGLLTVPMKVTLKEWMKADTHKLFLIYNQGKFEVARPMSYYKWYWRNRTHCVESGFDGRLHKANRDLAYQDSQAPSLQMISARFDDAVTRHPGVSL